MTVTRLETRLRRLEQRAGGPRPWERWAGVPVLEWPADVVDVYVAADGAKHLTDAELDALLARDIKRHGPFPDLSAAEWDDLLRRLPA